jgi:hypothetical protein
MKFVLKNSNKKNMKYLQRKKTTILIFLAFVPFVLSAQNDSQHIHRTTRNIAWFTPCGATKINGLAAGLQVMQVDHKNLTINGVNADIGLVAYMAVPDFLFSPILSRKKIEKLQGFDTTSIRINGLSLSFGGEGIATVNGVNLAGGITLGGSLNGISISGVFSKCNVFRGICISGMNNVAVKGVGIQVGLFNYCKDLKGLQIGLWNKCGKRGLPFINWGT